MSTDIAPAVTSAPVLLSANEELHLIRLIAATEETLRDAKSDLEHLQARLRHHMSAKQAEVVRVPGYEVKLETTYEYVTDCEGLRESLKGLVSDAEIDKAIVRKETVTYKAYSRELDKLKKFGGNIAYAIEKMHVRCPKSTKIVVTPVVEMKLVSEAPAALEAADVA